MKPMKMIKTIKSKTIKLHSESSNSKRRYSGYSACIAAIIAVFFALQLFVALGNQNVWWDEAVYAGMGMYLFSNGESGFWEDIRPPIMPVFFGIIWKLGLNPVFYDRLFSIILACGLLYTTYVLAKKAFGEPAGIIAALLLAAAPVFFGFSSVALSDIPSTFFASLALYFFMRGRLFISGFFSGISFLSRFPQMLIPAAIFAMICIGAIKSKNTLIRAIAIPSIPFAGKNPAGGIMAFSKGLGLVVVPYLISNYIAYRSFFSPFINAQLTVTGDYLWLYSGGITFYLENIYMQNFIVPLGLIGALYFALKKKLGAYGFSILLPAMLLLGYFTIMPHKEFRYILSYLPYFSIFAGALIYSAVSFVKSGFGSGGANGDGARENKASRGHKWVRGGGYALFGTLAKIAVCAVLAMFAFGIAAANIDSAYAVIKQQRGSISPEEQFSKIINSGDGSPVYSASPLIALYTKNKIYPLYSTLDYYIEASSKAEKAYLIVNTCAFPCKKGDAECVVKRDAGLKKIESANALLSKITWYGCDYYLYKRPRAYS